MAQPLTRGAPLRICSFGSDNKFTADDVRRRKQTIAEELGKVGIIMISYAADGDTRELKTMRQSIRFGIPTKKKAKKRTSKKTQGT